MSNPNEHKNTNTIVVERNKIEKGAKEIPKDKDMIIKDKNETFTIPGERFNMKMKDDNGEPVPDYVIDILLRDCGAFPEELENGQVKLGKCEFREVKDKQTGELIGICETQRYQWKDNKRIDEEFKKAKQARIDNPKLRKIEKPDDLIQIRSRTVEKRFTNLIKGLRQKLNIKVE